MPPPLCADNDGFSLNAAVPVEGHDRWRQVPLRLCIRRPALPDERVQRNAAGQIEPKRKRPWRDGTTQLVMGLQEFE